VLSFVLMVFIGYPPTSIETPKGDLLKKSVAVAAHLLQQDFYLFYTLEKESGAPASWNSPFQKKVIKWS
jgi:hypothetical protein